MQKIVRIGPSAGRIVEITKYHISFIDETGESRRIRIHPDSSSSSNTVAIHDLDQAPWTVKVFGDTRVTFTFESFEAAFGLLLNPLGRLGLKTLDAT